MINSIINVLKDKELNIKHKILFIITFNNLRLVSFILTQLVKVKSIFNSEYDKKFKIKYISKSCFSINTSEGSFFTTTPFRSLNLSRGIDWRLKLLSQSYGYEMFKNIFEKEVCVLDIGANIGEFSIFSAQKGANVLSVEHDKAVYETLVKNTETIKSIKTFNISISNFTGKQTVFYKTLTGSTTLIKPQNTEGLKELSLKNFSAEDKVTDFAYGVTLDDFIDDNKIEIIDLIKCDAEGAEPEIIEGLNRNKDKVKFISIDVGPERNGQRTETLVHKLLTDKGFEFLLEPNETQGRVIVAKNKKFI